MPLRSAQTLCMPYTTQTYRFHTFINGFKAIIVLLYVWFPIGGLTASVCTLCVQGHSFFRNA